MRARRGAAGLLAALVAVSVTAGCRWPGSNDDPEATSVFKVQVGDCFAAPPQVQAEIADLSKVTDCTKEHTLEAYDVTRYANVDGSDPAVFPGGDLLGKFAQGRCAQSYAAYVGVDYLDSKLFFTYLLPSARGWEAKDRTVICFVTTTGAKLTASVKGSKQ